MINIIDTDRCNCCESLRHERTLASCEALAEAAKWLIDHYDNAQLLDGIFNHIRIRDADFDYGPQECLALSGWNEESLNSYREQKRNAALKWLNLK